LVSDPTTHTHTQPARTRQSDPPALKNTDPFRSHLKHLKHLKVVDSQGFPY